MNQLHIPGDVRRFIQQCIPSVPFLEAALLMREQSARSWSSAQLAQRLYLSDAATAQLLRQLLDAGLVGDDGPAEAPYRYAPRTPDLRQSLERLAQVYASHLIEVSELIHLKSHRKAHLFADAFIWRKDR
jgi:hypothetical protein